MNRIVEYVKSLSNENKDKLIDILIKNAPDEIPDMQELRQDLDSDKTDVLNRAHMIFLNKKQYPKITISKLCYDFGISETTYKKHKSIHLKEWESQYNIKAKGEILWCAFDFARDGNLEDWEKYYNTAGRSIITQPQSHHSEYRKRLQ